MIVMRNLSTEAPPSSISPHRSSISPHPSDDVLDLCCGGKKCPSFVVDDDGILVMDAEQSASPIRFARSDIPRIIEWLSTRAT